MDENSRAWRGCDQCQWHFDTHCASVASSLTMPTKPLKALIIDEREHGTMAPCTVCSREAHRRHEAAARPHSAYYRRRPPTPADLDRLSRPKSVSSAETSNNCNWNNFIRRKSKYGKQHSKMRLALHTIECLYVPSAIKTPNALCDLSCREENSETRPPFINYGGRYDDKHYGEKRTFNSLAIHVCQVASITDRSSPVRLRLSANEAS